MVNGPLPLISGKVLCSEKNNYVLLILLIIFHSIVRLGIASPSKYTHKLLCIVIKKCKVQVRGKSTLYPSKTSFRP